MIDIRVPGDAAGPIKARIESRAADIVADVPGDTEPTGLRVADEVPGDWTVDTDNPLVVVADDAGPIVWPIWSVPRMRVTVYAYGKPLAKAIRQRLMGVLLERPVPAGLAHIAHDGIGYTDARDTETGADMASFTVEATVRTQVITV